MRIVFWGTYDTGKPRNRILLRGLRENGVDLIECHYHVWQGVEDKSRVKGVFSKLRFLFRWFAAYPVLLFRYCFLPKHDVVVIGYLGQLDVLVIWLFARLRGVTIVWDAFLSLHDTVVNDRRLCKPKSLTARLLYGWEWLACRAADKLILDTDAHGDFFCHHYKLSSQKIGTVFVGVEPEFFSLSKKKSERNATEEIALLFYGQCIPLHGIPTIISAARILRGQCINFTIIGSGQEQEVVQKMMDEEPLDSVHLVPWVEYEALQEMIAGADICLGIFGESDKAGRVIPNKVFQVVQAGKPLITRDSKGIREILEPEMPGVLLVAPSSPEALAEAILKARDLLKDWNAVTLFEDVRPRIQPAAIGKQLLKIL